MEQWPIGYGTVFSIQGSRVQNYSVALNATSSFHPFKVIQMSTKTWGSWGLSGKK